MYKQETEIGQNQLGINTLEEKYQFIIQRKRTEAAFLYRYVNQATMVQNEMRKILDPLTLQICGNCENKCCEGFPLEGWFSLEDYVLFRVKYGKPIPPPNRIKRDTACYFLTPEGCSLPEDMRPFTCVKINCEHLTALIKAIGKIKRFNQLKSALEKIHREVSPIINGNNPLSSPDSQPHQKI